jgi:SAM-dependent methyltransferase
MTSTPSLWQLPRGVTRGMWEYAHAEHIAAEYDDDLVGHPLFDFDEEIVRRYFTRPGLVVDLGCGTGRALIPLARIGFRAVAIDLSPAMLAIVGAKADEERLHVDRLRANLVELDCLSDGAADYAMCLFSTLGMIRGRDNRLRVLRHARRILKPGGLLVLHVHNLWYNLTDPLGRLWLARHVLESLRRRDVELGDKFFDYHQIPNMYLHVFTRTELLRSLKRAEFSVREIISLDTTRHRALKWPWLCGRLRANGWIAVCEKK